MASSLSSRLAWQHADPIASFLSSYIAVAFCTCIHRTSGDASPPLQARTPECVDHNLHRANVSGPQHCKTVELPAGSLARRLVADHDSHNWRTCGPRFQRPPFPSNKTGHLLNTCGKGDSNVRIWKYRLPFLNGDNTGVLVAGAHVHVCAVHSCAPHGNASRTTATTQPHRKVDHCEIECRHLQH